MPTPSARPAAATASRLDAFGVWPVMLTPFHADRSIDWPTLEPLVEWYLAAGVAGLFTCCGSGETLLLETAEKREMVERVVALAAGRVPVIAGLLGEVDDDERFAAVEAYRASGAAASVLVPNAFGPPEAPDAEVLDRMLAFGERCGDAALGLYECPAPYRRLLPVASVRTLAATGRFHWMKECSSDAEAVAAKVEAAAGTPLRIHNAATPILVEAVAAGANGYSGLAANFDPALCVRLCGAGRRPNRTAEEAAAQAALTARNDAEIVVDYPACAKRHLAREGVPIGPTCRV